MSSALRAFAGPLRYVQGPDALDSLGSLLAPFGPVPFIVTDGPVRALLGARLDRALARAGLHPVFGSLDGEITYAAVDRLVPGALVNVVVGVGGGKVLDAAKAVSLRLALPVVTVPTIASNDSPASAAIAMYDDSHVMVSVDRLPRHPALVVVDTALIAAAPVAFLRSGIGDAISKKFEAAGCRDGTGLTPLGARPLLVGAAIADAAYATIRTSAAAALTACAADVVTDDLEAVVEATILLSGLGFENGGLSLAHAMTRGLMPARGAGRAMHGLQVAWGLLVQLAAIDWTDADLLDLMAFYRSIELPVSLADLGLPDPTPAEIDAIVTLSLAAPHVLNLPIAVDAAIVTAAISRVESLAIGGKSVV